MSGILDKYVDIVQNIVIINMHGYMQDISYIFVGYWPQTLDLRFTYEFLQPGLKLSKMHNNK